MGDVTHCSGSSNSTPHSFLRPKYMDYDATFAKRGNAYKYAMDTCPHALDAELQTAVNMCGLSAGHILLNIPAGGVPLGPFVPSGVEYLCYETNASFAVHTGLPHCTLMSIPLPDCSVDAIVSVAALHHSTDKERADFYTEARRILKPGGRLVIGDVARGSAQDAWLNEFVHTHNSSGHQGQFWSHEDAQLLVSCGFSVEVSPKSYTWDFASTEEAVDFSRHLFGLDLATDVQIKEGIEGYLSPQVRDRFHIPWSLLYFIATVDPALPPPLEKK
jgi:SAM-dependent methyltransferase